MAFRFSLAPYQEVAFGTPNCVHVISSSLLERSQHGSLSDSICKLRHMRTAREPESFSILPSHKQHARQGLNAIRHIYACAHSDVNGTYRERRHPSSETKKKTLSTTSATVSIASCELMMSEIEPHLLSPMMQHYLSTKKSVIESLDCSSDRRVILMYRVGDFFESFFEDARILSEVCEIALTSKDAGKAFGERAPMAGIPHYCLDEKIKVLLERNVTVAVVDQVQSAAATPSGKLVKRAVTRLITPGTVCDDSLLFAKQSSYLVAIVVKVSSDRKGYAEDDDSIARGAKQFCFGFSYADVSTGEFRTTQGIGLDSLRSLLITVPPTEVLLVCPPMFERDGNWIEREIREAGVGIISKRHPLSLDASELILAQFQGVDNVESIGCRGKQLCTQASAQLLLFLRTALATENNNNIVPPLNDVKLFSTSDSMILDAACLKNLEVLESARDGIKHRSLQWAVDRTVTPMGGRCLRGWLMTPSVSLDTILQRQSVIEAFVKEKGESSTELQGMLRQLVDLERLAGRIFLGRVTPREFQCLCQSIVQIPLILEIIRDTLKKHLPEVTWGTTIISLTNPLNGEIERLACRALDAMIDPAPSSLPSELAVFGGVLKDTYNASETQIFRSGYNEQLDRLRDILVHPESWIQELEERERARTNIESLRIKHIRNVGYVLRVPRSTGERVMHKDPTFFLRMGYQQVQSTRAEVRFRFEELSVREKVFHSGFSQVLNLELRLYDELRKEMASHVKLLRSVGIQMAQLDALAGLSQVALERQYVKPEMIPGSTRTVQITDARHPIVEQTLPPGKTFVPNSFEIGQNASNDFPDLMILCGPNAAGKSCALRSVGLVSILAQIGSFVPARAAKLSLCDRIFTRVGAVDDLARGQSTFQVEMAETACILTNATSQSLVLLDEIGRGTSAVDGISIAWSVSEFLARKAPPRIIPPRCIFVTHYHELNHLPSILDNIKSFHLHMAEIPVESRNGKSRHNGGPVTTYNVIPGPSYDSFGIAIAERAGFPAGVVARARQVADLLRVPSQAIGVELKSQLVSAAGKPEARSSNNAAVTKEGPKVSGAAKDSYKSGYEDGYRAALKEVHSRFEYMLRRVDNELTSEESESQKVP